MDDVLTLHGAESRTKDEYGVWRTKKSQRKVFCDVKSATFSEFYAGGRAGLNPEFTFTIFAGDYNGETVVEYQRKTYSVYRTYRKDSDYLELHVERKGGTNGQKEDQD